MISKTTLIATIAICLIAFAATADNRVVRIDPQTPETASAETRARPSEAVDHSEDYEFIYDDGYGGLSFTMYPINSFEGLRISVLHPCTLRTLEFYAMGPGTLEVHIWEVDSVGWPLNTELISPFRESIDSTSWPAWVEIDLLEPLYIPAFGECLVGRKVLDEYYPVTVYLTSMEDVEDRSFLQRVSTVWQKPTYTDTSGSSWNVTYMIRAYGDYYEVPDECWFEIDSTSITTSNKGVAFGDFDLDGDFDLLTSGQLFGNSSGSFSVVSGTGMSGSGYPYWGELDLNQYPDPFIAGATNDKLFANNSGSGDFYDVTDVAGGISNPYPTECAAWLDYDKDGDLDLFVANGGTYDPSDSSWDFYRDYFYENDGAYFFDVTGSAGMSPTLDNPQCGSGAALGDWNNDGRIDIYVANTQGSPNNFWQNLGGEFMDMSYAIGIDGVNEGGGVYGSSGGACFGDIDNDGDLDLFVANQCPGRSSINSDKSMLYINLGPSDYYMWNEAAERGINYVKSRAMPFMIDFDNDGWLDIFVASNDGRSFSHLYRNLGDGTFEDITRDAGLAFKSITGAGWSDIDSDGDMDLVAGVGSHKVICENNYEAITGIDNNWVRFICRGDSSNGLGMGTRVKLKAGGQWQIREIGSGYGAFGCQSEYTAHFGLGTASIIDTVIFEWQSGLAEIVTALAPNGRYIVNEGDFNIDETSNLPTDLEIRTFPNPFNGNCRLMIDDLGLGIDAIEIFDVNGRIVEILAPLNKGGCPEGTGGILTWQPAPSLGSGVYLVRATIGEQTATRRVVYLK